MKVNLWDVMIQCERQIMTRKPDVVLVNKNDRRYAIIDLAVPGDIKVTENEKEKVERYQELKREIRRM